MSPQSPATPLLSLCDSIVRSHNTNLAMSPEVHTNSRLSGTLLIELMYYVGGTSLVIIGAVMLIRQRALYGFSTGGRR